jgi:hypothetical protein
LKELSESELPQSLFIDAYKEAADGGDLWWQIRALQELGWDDARRELLIGHAEEIRQSEDAMLLRELAWAEGDSRGYVWAAKQMAVQSDWMDRDLRAEAEEETSAEGHASDSTDARVADEPDRDLT